MTTKTLETIKRMNQVELLCDAEIARRIGEKQHIVNRWRKKLNLEPGKKGMKHKKRYTFYDKQTTQFICEGTIEECARAMGLSVNSMYSIISRNRSGKQQNYEVYEVEE